MVPVASGEPSGDLSEYREVIYNPKSPTVHLGSYYKHLVLHRASLGVHAITGAFAIRRKSSYFYSKKN